MFANLPLFLSYYPPLILIFAENYNQKHPHMSPITERNGEMMRRGRIEVICGSMFSGKTEELIRRLKRAEFARQMPLGRRRIHLLFPGYERRRSMPYAQHFSHEAGQRSV